MLGAMFSGRHHVEPNAEGHYFFDRDPDHVTPIINFYRTRKLILGTGVNVGGVKEEARYFGMYEEIFGGPENPQLVFRVRREYTLNTSPIKFQLMEKWHALPVVSCSSGRDKIMVGIKTIEGTDINGSDAVLWDGAAFPGGYCTMLRGSSSEESQDCESSIIEYKGPCEISVFGASGSFPVSAPDLRKKPAVPARKVMLQLQRRVLSRLCRRESTLQYLQGNYFQRPPRQADH
ncbi:hypothetical protein HK102_000137 [Quaeritorhiza haematococci]|nr:hypothetical protein HK102_000137 [Quaeritorhiza haematococci]